MPTVALVLGVLASVIVAGGAGDGAALAVNVSGLLVNAVPVRGFTAVACKVLLFEPDTGPRTQLPTVATPDAFVSTWIVVPVPLRTPPPPVTVKVTAAHETGSL